jgi:hypothetical protein
MNYVDMNILANVFLISSISFFRLSAQVWNFWVIGCSSVVSKDNAKHFQTCQQICESDNFLRCYVVMSGLVLLVIVYSQDM